MPTSPSLVAPPPLPPCRRTSTKPAQLYFYYSSARPRISRMNCCRRPPPPPGPPPLPLSPLLLPFFLRILNTITTTTDCFLARSRPCLPQLTSSHHTHALAGRGPSAAPPCAKHTTQFVAAKTPCRVDAEPPSFHPSSPARLPTTPLCHLLLLPISFAHSPTPPPQRTRRSRAAVLHRAPVTPLSPAPAPLLPTSVMYPPWVHLLITPTARVAAGVNHPPPVFATCVCGFCPCGPLLLWWPVCTDTRHYGGPSVLTHVCMYSPVCTGAHTPPAEVRAPFCAPATPHCPTITR